MSGAAEFDDRVMDRIRDAARWRLAGLLFRRPRPGWHAEIVALSREAGDTDLSAAVGAAADASEGTYLALLGPGGSISPREVSYRPLQDPGRLLAEIAAFQEAFSYRAGAEDPRDHVAAAADFVGFLALKEAYADGAGRSEDAETTREARERFVERHVRAIARGMLRRLERIDCPVDYLPAALRALCVMSGADAEADEPSDDGPFLRPGLDEAVFDCGGLDDVRAPGACAEACRWPTGRAHTDESGS